MKYLFRAEYDPRLQKAVLLENVEWVRITGRPDEPLLFKKNGLLGVFPGMTEGEICRNRAL